MNEAGDPLIRAEIRAERQRARLRTLILDDDPTGSQSVHDVPVLIPGADGAPLAEGLAEELAAAASACFVLTNTRSLDPAEATALNRRLVVPLLAANPDDADTIELVSRSDSTLRGHVITEIEALDAARREVLGAGHDAVLLAPAYLEAGRFTLGDVHWAVVGGRELPVGETEFARDASFGYTESDLRRFVAEKTGGRVAAAEVLSIGLDDIREGGPERVAEIVSAARGAGALRYAVVNAVDYSDLELVARGAQLARAQGARLLFRTGPSFVRALLGQEPIEPLDSVAIRAGRWHRPDREPGQGHGHRHGHGLVAVGSHVGQTVAQLNRLRLEGGFVEVELPVRPLLDPSAAGPALAEVRRRVREALDHDDVLLYTSREVVTAPTADDSLRIAREVSDALTAVVAGALPARPGWIVAKGGITSHDIAAHGLGIRRATVLGQLFPGMVSVLRVDESSVPGAADIRYVVFAGNVGDTDALARVVTVLRDR